jgi:hypothetical protein
MPSIKKVKFCHGQRDLEDSMHSDVLIPLGLQWQNNSCAYDAVFTILYNVWREDPKSVDTAWREIQSELLNSVLDAFRLHKSNVSVVPEAQYALEEIRDYIRRRLARLSPNFAFGKYASIDSIFNCLLSSPNPITKSERVCPNAHVIERREIVGSSCDIPLIMLANRSLQAYLDDFTVPLSSTCPVCAASLLRKYAFTRHPPLFAAELGLDATASVDHELCVSAGNVLRQYKLRGLVYFSADHFTVRVVTKTGMVWFHDGILTGQALIYENPLTNGLPRERPIAAIYIRSPKENSDMPCEATAH